MKHFLKIRKTLCGSITVRNREKSPSHTIVFQDRRKGEGVKIKIKACKGILFENLLVETCLSCSWTRYLSSKKTKSILVCGSRVYWRSHWIWARHCPKYLFYSVNCSFLTRCCLPHHCLTSD